jgi:hypothetical protein
MTEREEHSERDEGYSEREQEHPDLRPDELLEKIAPDGEPDAIRLVGVRLGTSPRDNHMRLFLNPNLTEYVDFLRDDAVASEKYESEEFPNRQVVIWVRPSARLHFGATSSIEASFLQGEIQGTFLPRTGIGDIFFFAEEEGRRPGECTRVNSPCCVVTAGPDVTRVRCPKPPLTSRRRPCGFEDFF